MNFGARLYCPQTGRFLSVDPLWQAFRSLTPYHYAYNSPLSYKDPTGLAPVKEKGERVMATLLDLHESSFSMSNYYQEQAEYRAMIDEAINWQYASSNGSFYNLYIGTPGGGRGGASTSGRTGSSSEKKEGNGGNFFSKVVKGISNAFRKLFNSYKENIIHICLYDVIEPNSNGHLYSDRLKGFTFKNPASQLGLLLTANPIGKWLDVQFIQTYVCYSDTQNEEKIDISGLSIFNKRPFFNSDEIVQKGGKLNGNYGLFDGPAILNLNEDGTSYSNAQNVFWEATTSLIGLAPVDNQWRIITTFSWGYTLDQSGIMNALPFTIRDAPTIQHINIINNLNRR